LKEKDTRQNLEFNAALRRCKLGVAIELLRECQEDYRMGGWEGVRERWGGFAVKEKEDE